VTYRVTHTERYTLQIPPKIYKTLDELKKRYVRNDLFYEKLFNREVAPLKSGEKTYFMYDFYIKLYVERLE